MLKRTVLLALVATVIPSFVLADIGVGVGAGKIQLNEKLKPGATYTLPTLPVLNTGDEPGEYGISIEYHEGQPQHRPPKEWFAIEPDSFRLEPAAVTTVNLKISVPVKAVPGEYFAYIEAHPIKSGVAGQTSVGIAAATKLYFVVAPSNIFQGAYYLTASFLDQYAPTTYVALTVVGVALLLMLLRRFVSFSIGVRRK